MYVKVRLKVHLKVRLKAYLKKSLMLRAVLLLLCFCAISNVSLAQDTGFKIHMPEVVGYFASWKVYGSNTYFVKDMVETGAIDSLTVINYAFSDVRYGKCLPGDDWADYKKEFTAEQSLAGVEDDASMTLKGNFRQLKLLKEQYPKVKIVIALGGGRWSGHFSDLALTEESRAAFVRSCIDMYIHGNLPGLEDGAGAGVFDGIDIDWEYPAVKGYGHRNYRPADTENFTLLLEEFRKQLSAIDKSLILTTAVPAGEDRYSKLELDKIHYYLDWMNVMTYDFRGNFQPQTAHNANLYLSAEDPYTKAISINTTVRDYLDAGVPAHKLIIGIPLYGVGWSGVGSRNNGLFQASNRAGGVRTYKRMVEYLEDDYVRYFDDDAKSSWIYDGHTFYTFEDIDVINLKLDYVRELGLRGAMFWTIDGDHTEESLITEAYTNLYSENFSEYCINSCGDGLANSSE